MQEKCKHNLRPCNGKSRSRGWQLPRVSNSARLTLLALTLSACQTTRSDETSVPKGADFCTAARAIYYSRHDTPPTIAQIREHNAVGLALKCGWLPAKKSPTS
jgi:hypothetical protein